VKPIVVISLGAEFFVAIWFASETCILRLDLTRAMYAAKERPSPETFVELERQRRISEGVQFALGAGVFAVLALPTLGLARCRAILERRSNPAPIR